MKNKTTLTKIDEHIIGVIFLMAVLLPHTGVLYLINPLLLLFLALRYSSRIKSPIQEMLVIIVVVSLAWNVLAGVEITSKSFIRAVYICELFLFFPFCKSIRIPNLYLYSVSGIILLSQLSTVLNVGPLITLFDTVYPPNGEFEWQTSDYLVSHAQDADSLSDLQKIRFGGLFHNANQCMKYMSLCFIVFLIENFSNKFKQLIPFIIITVISTLLAGSRTGFIIILLASVTVFYMRNHNQKTVDIKRIIIPLSISVLFLYLISSAVDLRIFQIAIGGEKDGSISVKYENLDDYLQRINTARALLVGNFSMESVKDLYHTYYTGFDSEWGDAIYMYGFAWLFLYGLFLLHIIRNIKGVEVISVFILIWIVSSTMILSYRTSFAFMLVLSKYYYSSWIRKKYINYDKSI